MSGHVISTLQGMLIFGSIDFVFLCHDSAFQASLMALAAPSVLWNEPIENGFHINTNIGICILIDAQSATRMLAEYIDDARLRQLGQLAQYLTGHQMESARLRF